MLFNNKTRDSTPIFCLRKEKYFFMVPCVFVILPSWYVYVEDASKSAPKHDRDLISFSFNPYMTPHYNLPFMIKLFYVNVYKILV